MGRAFRKTDERDHRFHKNMTIMEQSVTVKSSLKDVQMAELEAMADAIVESMK